jgi:hypothetical protein
MKSKQVVFSSSDDGNQCFIDFVMAESEDEAKEEVRRVRSGALPIFATDLRTLYELTCDLAMTTPDEVEATWNQVKSFHT